MACYPAIHAECHAAIGSPVPGGTRPVSLAYSFRLDLPLPDAVNPRPVESNIESNITQLAIAGSRSRVESTVRLISILSQQSMVTPRMANLTQVGRGDVAEFGQNRTLMLDRNRILGTRSCQKGY
jgi:hypothetical protein